MNERKLSVNDISDLNKRLRAYRESMEPYIEQYKIFISMTPVKYMVKENGSMCRVESEEEVKMRDAIEGISKIMLNTAMRGFDYTNQLCIDTK